MGPEDHNIVSLMDWGGLISEHIGVYSGGEGVVSDHFTQHGHPPQARQGESRGVSGLSCIPTGIVCCLPS